MGHLPSLSLIQQKWILTDYELLQITKKLSRVICCSPLSLSLPRTTPFEMRVIRACTTALASFKNRVSLNHADPDVCEQNICCRRRLHRSCQHAHIPFKIHFPDHKLAEIGNMYFVVLAADGPTFSSWLNSDIISKWEIVQMGIFRQYWYMQPFNYVPISRIYWCFRFKIGYLLHSVWTVNTLWQYLDDEWGWEITVIFKYVFHLLPLKEKKRRSKRFLFVERVCPSAEANRSSSGGESIANDKIQNISFGCGRNWSKFSHVLVYSNWVFHGMDTFYIFRPRTLIGFYNTPKLQNIDKNLNIKSRIIRNNEISK